MNLSFSMNECSICSSLFDIFFVSIFEEFFFVRRGIEIWPRGLVRMSNQRSIGRKSIRKTLNFFLLNLNFWLFCEKKTYFNREKEKINEKKQTSKFLTYRFCFEFCIPLLHPSFAINASCIYVPFLNSMCVSVCVLSFG